MNKFVTDDCINKMQKFINDVGVNVQPYTFRDSINIKIDKIKISHINNKIQLYLDDDVTTKYNNYWKDSTVQILLNDIKQNNLSYYYYIIFDNNYYLLREVEQNEDIRIVDKKYIVLISSNNEKFITTNIKFNSEFESINLTDDNDVDIEIEDDELVSLALFDNEDIEF